MSHICYGCGGCFKDVGLTVTAQELREHQTRAGCNVKLEELDEAHTIMFRKMAHDNRIGTCACGTIVSIKVDGEVHGGHTKMCEAPSTRSFLLGQDGKPNGDYIDMPKSSAAAAAAAATTGNRKSAPKHNGAGGARRAAARGAASGAKDAAIVEQGEEGSEANNVADRTRAKTKTASERLEATVAAYKEILEAVREGNEERAEAAVRQLEEALARPMHARALPHSGAADTRDKRIIETERALHRYAIDGRMSEFVKRILSLGLADVSNPAVQESLKNCYNVAHNAKVQAALGGEAAEELLASAEEEAIDERNAAIAAKATELIGDELKIKAATMDEFEAAAAGLASDKSALNGTSNDFIAVLGSKEGKRVVFELINMVLGGELHRATAAWERLSRAKLFAIRKDASETNVRGIAVGEMLLKLASRIMLKRHSVAMRKATPCNFANGAPGGADAFARLAQEFAGNAAYPTIRLDIEKAFDRVDIVGVMQALHDLGLSDELIRFTQLWYCMPTSASVTDATRKELFTLRIVEGLRQGCPMSMALWGISAEPYLARAREVGGGDVAVANEADDVATNGPPLPLARTLYTIAGGAHKKGNKVSGVKTFALIHGGEMAKALREALKTVHAEMVAEGYDGPDLRNIPFVERGFYASGVPCGTPDYIHEELAKMAQQIIADTARIADCLDPHTTGRSAPLSAQGFCEILRSAVLPRWNHVMRAHTPDLTLPHCRTLDADMDRTLRMLFGAPPPCEPGAADAEKFKKMLDEKREHYGWDPSLPWRNDITVMTDVEASWQRMYLGAGLGLGFHKHTEVAAAAYIGATALVAPLLHVAYGSRSRMPKKDHSASDEALLYPLHRSHDKIIHRYLTSTMVQNADNYSRIKKGSKDEKELKTVLHSLSRASLCGPTREDGSVGEPTPVHGQQRAISKFMRLNERLLALAIFDYGYSFASGDRGVRARFVGGDAKMDAILPLDEETIARNHSLANLKGLNASMRDRENRMTDRQFILAVRLALGIPILEEGQECPCCGAALSATGAHAFSCGKGKGLASATHDRVVRLVAAEVKLAGAKSEGAELRVTTDQAGEGGLRLDNDPAYLHSLPSRIAENADADAAAAPEGEGAALRGKAKRRAKAALVAIEADLRVQRIIDAPALNPVAARANTVTVDVTITSPVGASILGKAAAEQGAAARAAEARKDAHYRLYYPADGANVDVLAIETFGFISDKSQATLEKIARLASGISLSADLKELKSANRRLFNIYVANLARLRERISVALWQGNAYTIDMMLSKWSGVSPLRFAHALPFEGPAFPNGLSSSYAAGLAAAAPEAEAEAALAE